MRRKAATRRKSAPKPRRQIRWPTLPDMNWGLLANVCLLAVFSVMTYFGTLWLMDRPINSVRIEGRFERVTAVQVEGALTPYLDDGFLSLNIGEVQRAVARLPWVERASIRRSWPAALNVTVTEQRAAARWGNNGLLNVYGELFVREAKHVPAELPRLNGPDGTALQVAKLYFDLDARLQQRGLKAVELSLDARGSWELELSNGVQVRLGADDVDNRAARFFVALDGVLESLSGTIDYVDMRYTNGFAIGWKAGSEMRMAELGEATSNVW